MNGARPQFLSRPGFAGYQHGDVARRNFLRQRQYLGQNTFDANHGVGRRNFHFLRAAIVYTSEGRFKTGYVRTAFNGINVVYKCKELR